MSHFKTWLLWLDTISPMQKTISNFTGQERQAMAEALAMASPQGPSGFQCVDECQCQKGLPKIEAAVIYGRICDRMSGRPDPETLPQLEQAISADLVRPQIRILPAQELMETGVIVSTRNERVVGARTLFPRTWGVIKNIFNES